MDAGKKTGRINRLNPGRWLRRIRIAGAILALLLCVSVSATGCAWEDPLAPGLRPVTTPPATAAGAATPGAPAVAQPEPAPADPVDERVQNFIARIDDIGVRARQREQAPPRPTLLIPQPAGAAKPRKSNAAPNTTPPDEVGVELVGDVQPANPPAGTAGPDSTNASAANASAANASTPNPSAPNVAAPGSPANASQANLPASDNPAAAGQAPGAALESPPASQTPDDSRLLGESRPIPDHPPAQPTTLEISAATDAPRAAQANTPESASVNGALAAPNALPTLEDFVARLPRDAVDASFKQQLDDRMLRALAGDLAGARAPLNLVTAEQQETASRFIEALLAIRAGHGGDPEAAAKALRELEPLTETLRRASALSIPTLAICRAVRAFGQYDLFEPPLFTAGTPAEFVLYCEVRDFVSDRREDGLYLTQFDLTTRILNKAGETVLELHDPNITDRCRVQRRDCFIPRLVRLPATLSPGEYVAKVTLADKLGNKLAEQRATFKLTAPKQK